MPLLSLTQYARHRGCSISSVQDAVRRGRITRNEDGTIDSEQADRDWEANTNHKQARYKKPETPPAAIHRRDPSVDSAAGLKRAGTWAAKHAQALANEANPEGVSYTAAKSAKAFYDARLTKLAYEARLGKLISREHVEVAYSNLLQGLRDAILNVPSRLAAQITAETDTAVVYDLMYKELALTLETASKARPL